MFYNLPEMTIECLEIKEGIVKFSSNSGYIPVPKKYGIKECIIVFLENGEVMEILRFENKIINTASYCAIPKKYVGRRYILLVPK